MTCKHTSRFAKYTRRRTKTAKHIARGSSSVLPLCRHLARINQAHYLMNAIRLAVMASEAGGRVLEFAGEEVNEHIQGLPREVRSAAARRFIIQRCFVVASALGGVPMFR